jgi:hypothetical protein
VPDGPYAAACLVKMSGGITRVHISATFLVALATFVLAGVTGSLA